MEKKRYTVIALFLIAAMMSACLLTACFGRKVLFSCDPDNAAGINSVDFRNGRTTLYFDKEKALSGEMRSIFEDTDKTVKITFTGKYGSDDFGPANIKIDKERMTVQIDNGYDNADNISKILLYSDRDQLSLNLLNGKLQTRIVVSTEGVCGPLRGPLTTTFRITSQSYDKESRCWSEPVQETGDLTIYQ